MTQARRPSALALVRHGESVWIVEGRFQGRGDPPLSDYGLRQATAVGARLAEPEAAPAVPLPHYAPVAIWHSPLKRAAQTARAIHEAREGDAPLIPLDTLSELGQGEWEGLTHDTVRERWPDELAAWREDPLANNPPGGETLSAALQRARAATAAILGTDGDVTTQDVPTEDAGPGHARSESGLGAERHSSDESAPTDAPPWSMVVAHDGILRLLMLDLIGVDITHYWSFPFALASVTVIDLGGSVARLRAHNLDEHIAALGR